ncbi:hypothetical protein LINGRAHAP2_LOCUS20254 [Linum grandiflorum]
MPKPLHALHHDLARQWKIRPREVSVYEAGHGLIQFVFSSIEARATAYQKQPWCYKNQVINLIPWELPSQEVFDRLQFMPITIQFSDFPSYCNTVEFGKEILAPVGEVL